MVNQFCIFVILLNFLIAVITQSYEKVMNSATILKYQNKTAYNREAFQIITYLGFGKKKLKTIIMSVAGKDNGDDCNQAEWSGFVQTIKSFIKK